LQDPISKKFITRKGWWSGPNSKSDCLASVRPWVQPQGPQKN
jgi:hypothetical protein